MIQLLLLLLIMMTGSDKILLPINSIAILHIGAFWRAFQTAKLERGAGVTPTTTAHVYVCSIHPTGDTSKS